MIAKNIAPGLYRYFAFENFAWYDVAHLETARADAKAKIITDKEHTIIGSDSDKTMIAIAQENALNA